MVRIANPLLWPTILNHTKHASGNPPQRVTFNVRWYYMARETRIFARQLKLKPCFTLVQSPQSNGISESFVNTLKRDYVHVTLLPDAETVLGLIDGWIEDYNENHPHSGLKMHSPREFIAAQTATA